MEKSGWDKQHDKYLETEWIHRPNLFAQFALEQGYLPASGTVLDLGGGQGQDARFFAAHGLNVTLLESSQRALELARDKARASDVELATVAADLADPLPFADESFDVVWSHLAVHYFDEATTQRLFGEIERILKPGGVVGLMVNSADDPEIPRLTSIATDYYLEERTGLKKRYFTPETLRTYIPDSVETLLLDARGETHKDPHSTIVRFIGRKL